MKTGQYSYKTQTKTATFVNGTLSLLVMRSIIKSGVKRLLLHKWFTHHKVSIGLEIPFLRQFSLTNTSKNGHFEMPTNQKRTYDG